MDILINIGIVLLTFLVMEGVAWLTHKYVMHGFFWFLHSDHHNKDHDDFLERNDFFFLIFAIPGIICLALGNFYGNELALYIGIGITLYGACYFLVHDIFIHQRFKVLRNSDNWYLKAIRRAHKMHHKHLGKEQGECFGMLWVPFKYFLEARKKA
ncbi:sterol desaturase family protein [Pedobacter boryungensis]|uniref:Sterol desaturase family protein n=1 Tax=Pedobacter boryungensis TaxID=869962 RepID=A0ABX2DB10_9SPHI|nr:sterol desaturase family protein [Pedobacter boryungensis]NQX30623.1 sterol desaturase family protein [Pedobacter boryungensis]